MGLSRSGCQRRANHLPTVYERENDELASSIHKAHDFALVKLIH